MVTSKSLYGSGSSSGAKSTTKTTSTNNQTSKNLYGGSTSTTTAKNTNTTSKSSAGTDLSKSGIAYKTLDAALQSGAISKTDLSAFTNMYMQTAKKLGLDYNDPKNYGKVLASMDPKFVAQYGAAATQLQNALGLSGIEASYGTNTASLLGQYSDPAQAQKKYNDILNAVQNDPKFNEFWNKYKSFVEQNYNIKVESLQQQLDYALKENQLASTKDTQDYNQTVQDVNKSLEFSLKDINQQRVEAQQDYNNLQQDVDKYIGYANSDYVTGLAKVDVNVADALQKATESYGQRNLINSGIQSIGTGKITGDSTAQKTDLYTDKTRTIDKYTTEGIRGKQTLQNILDKLGNTQAKAEYGTTSTLTKAERDYLYNQSRFNLESGKLKDLNDIALKQASADREQALYDIQNKSTSQAYTLAGNQFNTEQNSVLRQILGNMIQ